MTAGRSRSGRKLGDNRVFWYLKRNGVSTINTIPGGYDGLRPDAKRVYDIRTFGIRGGNPNNSVPCGPGVAYLGGYHDEEEVLREWIAANRDGFEKSGTTRQAITSALSGRFKDVWRDIAGDYDFIRNPVGGHGETGAKGRDCPFCGEAVKILARHLRGGCSNATGEVTER